MKKFILIAILSFFSLSLSAKTPNLNVEKIFDGSYNTNPNVSINITRSEDKYFRGCDVTNDINLVNEIEKLFDKDLPRAKRTQDIFSNGSKFRSMTIVNNDEEIKIGMHFNNDNNGCYLFISGAPNAFK